MQHVLQVNQEVFRMKISKKLAAVSLLVLSMGCMAACGRNDTGTTTDKTGTTTTPTKDTATDNNAMDNTINETQTFTEETTVPNEAGGQSIMEGSDPTTAADPAGSGVTTTEEVPPVTPQTGAHEQNSKENTVPHTTAQPYEPGNSMGNSMNRSTGSNRTNDGSLLEDAGDAVGNMVDDITQGVTNATDRMMGNDRNTSDGNYSGKNGTASSTAEHKAK